jgi:hypothetical protein
LDVGHAIYCAWSSFRGWGIEQTPPRLAVRLSGVKAHRNNHGLKRGKRKHQKQPVFPFAL